MTPSTATSAPSTSLRGLGAMVAAIGLFGIVFYLSGVVDASAEVVFGWRIVITCVCYLLALAHPTPRAMARAYLRAATRNRWTPLLLVALCGLVGVQLWLFSWAPLHGHALDASLGFLLLPISLVLAAKLVLGSPVSTPQWVATGIAVLAVGIKIGLSPQVSWVTLVICLGYPTYFVLRQRFGLDNPMAFGAEVTLLSPICLILIFAGQAEHPAGPAGMLALAAVGVSGAAAMALFLAASKLLPLPLFGLLTYLEPVVLVLVALLLGERPGAADLATYGLLAVALAVLSVEGYRRGRSSQAQARGNLS